MDGWDTWSNCKFNSISDYSIIGHQLAAIQLAVIQLAAIQLAVLQAAAIQLAYIQLVAIQLAAIQFVAIQLAAIQLVVCGPNLAVQYSAKMLTIFLNLRNQFSRIFKIGFW